MIYAASLKLEFSYLASSNFLIIFILIGLYLKYKPSVDLFMINLQK